MTGVGSEAFVFWRSRGRSRSKSPGKARLEGGARVRVLAVEGDRYRTVVVAGSGVPVGIERTFERGELFFEELPAETAHFEKLVRYFWGGGPPPGPRPPIDDGGDLSDDGAPTP